MISAGAPWAARHAPTHQLQAFALRGRRVIANIATPVPTFLDFGSTRRVRSCEGAAEASGRLGGLSRHTPDED